MNPCSSEFLQELMMTGVRRCQPDICLPPHLQDFLIFERVCVIALGKAAVQMAAVAYEVLGDRCFGLAITRHGFKSNVQTGAIDILEASHPVPDETSVAAAEQVLSLAEALDEQTPVLFLVSGGGSSLMTMPVSGVPFSDLQDLYKFLLRSGAPIEQVNLIRRSVSAIKGGKLLNWFAPNQVQTLAISDVVGDDPQDIACGPTVASVPRQRDALKLLQRYNWTPISSIERCLSANSNETSARSNAQSKTTIIASARDMLRAAAQFATERGCDVRIVGEDITGEAAIVGREHADLVRNLPNSDRPVLILSGGELTVSLISQHGLGGPNQEYLLSFVCELSNFKGVIALACDSDGVDGFGDVTGAYFDQRASERMKSLNLDPFEYLSGQDSSNFFDQVGTIVKTGALGTNVNDFRAILRSPGY